MFPPTRARLIGDEQDDWTRIWLPGQRGQPGQSGQYEGLEDDDHKWTFGKKRKLMFSKLVRRWENVRRGMDIDIEAGKQKGEKEPAEYWDRVWSDMHQGQGGPPGNLPVSVLRDKWSEMKDGGKTDQECWDTLEIQYPVAFLGLPLLNRWEHLGEGKGMDETKGNMFGWMPEFNAVFLTDELKEKLDEMKKSGEEDTFWRSNWDTVHKRNSCRMRQEDGEGFIFPVMRRNEHGDLVRMEPTYKEYYPSQIGRINCRVKSNSVEDQPLFQQFDFA